MEMRNDLCRLGMDCWKVYTSDTDVLIVEPLRRVYTCMWENGIGSVRTASG